MSRYNRAQRERIAADHDRWAEGKERLAARLRAEGKTVAADTQARAAQERREVAEAARTSSDALNEILNPL